MKLIELRNRDIHTLVAGLEELTRSMELRLKLIRERLHEKDEPGRAHFASDDELYKSLEFSEKHVQLYLARIDLLRIRLTKVCLSGG